MDLKRFLPMILLTSLLLFPMMFSGVTTSQEYSSRGVDIQITGEDEVFVDEDNIYEVTIGGDFGEDAENWTLNADVSEGEAAVAPRTQESNTSNTFTVEMTAVEPGTVSIEFEGRCFGDNETRQDVRIWEVNVLEVTQTSVVVNNPTDTDIEDLKVGLFVSGELKRTMRIGRLEANSEREIQFNWSKENLDSGEHKMEIWVDYGFVEENDFNKDELILEKNVYIPDDTMHTIYSALIVLLIVGIIAGFFYYQHKRKKRRRPW